MKKTTKHQEKEAWSIIRNTVEHIEKGNSLEHEAPLTSSAIAGILEWKRGLVERGKPLPLCASLESIMTRLTQIGRELDELGEMHGKADTTLVDAVLDLARDGTPEPLAWMGNLDNRDTAALAFAVSLFGQDFKEECGGDWGKIYVDATFAFRIAGAYLTSVASTGRDNAAFLLLLAAVALERARKGGTPDAE